MLGDDQSFKKKAFTNLDSLGDTVTSGDSCCVDVCAKEGNTRIVATTFKNISYSNQIDRLSKF